MTAIDFLTISEHVPIIEKVHNVVREKFNVDFLGDNVGTKRKVVTPRQIYIYCLYVFTDLTLKQIAALVGKKDHTTIIYSVRVVKDICCTNQDYRKEIIQIESMIE